MLPVEFEPQPAMRQLTIETLDTNGTEFIS
jgi:hypothetical protein